jgi:hypothetical protein
MNEMAWSNIIDKNHPTIEPRLFLSLLPFLSFVLSLLTKQNQGGNLCLHEH